MPTREELDARLRQISGLTGVPFEVLSELQGSESRDTNIGFHDPTRKSSAYGPFGITKGFAENYPGLDRFNWQDNALMAAQELRKNFDKFGNWGDAMEAHKLGAGGVGNARSRALHPKEAAAADRLRQMVFRSTGGERMAFPGVAGEQSTLYPNPWGSPQGNMDRMENIVGGLQSTLNEPVNLPRTPVPGQRSVVGEVLPGLFANMATAISNNPLYQQAFQRKLIEEEQARDAAKHENLQISREEIMQNRQARIQGKMQELELAKQRAENSREWALRDVLDERQRKLMIEQEKLHGQIQEDLKDKDYQRAIDLKMLDLGLRRGTNGEWEPDPTVSKWAGMMTEDQIQSKVQGIMNILADKKRDKRWDKVLNAQLDNLQYTMPRRTDNAEAVEQRINQKYTDLAVSGPMIKTVLLKNPWIPGAQAWIDEYEIKLKAALDKIAKENGATRIDLGASEAELERQRTEYQRILKVQTSQPSPAPAPRSVKSQTLLPDTTQRTPKFEAMPVDVTTPDTAASHSVQQADRLVKGWEDVIKKGAMDPVYASQQLADAYRKREKARKDQEDIQNKGKKPEKSKK